MKSFRTSAVIQAPAETIWKILTDGSRWTEWNSTVSKLEGRIALGEKVIVSVKANPGRAFPLTVTEFAAPHRMVWSGGMPLGLFTGARTYTLTPRGDGSTEFTMHEQFTGLLAPLIGKSIPDLQPSFDEFARCLKAHAEAGAGKR